MEQNKADKKLRNSYYRKEWRKTPAGQRNTQKWNNSPKRRLGYYRNNCQRRGREFSLTEEQAFKLFASPCFYCGEPNSNGIDRYDNDKGYTEENAVACCWKCNHWKSVDEALTFVNHCVKVANHWTKSNQ